MASRPPTKPPRGVKYVKETSGLLMSVIRSLSASETNEQRDREKAKLEKEYKRSDQKLDELVLEHEKNLTQVIQLFTKLSADVTVSRQKIHIVKENLQACKQLLRCRRDELKKLWLEGIEHKHVLQLLNEIDYLKKVPSQLGNYLSKRHYLHASKLLVSAIKLGEGPLKDVEALWEVRSDLQSRREILYSKLLEELSRHIYYQSTQDVLALRRQGSGRDLFASPFQRNELRRSFNERVVSKAKKNLLEAMSGADSLFVKNSNESSAEEITEDLNSLDPELSSTPFIAIVIESVALLNRLPEAIEVIKVQMQTEILEIISRTSQQILDNPILPVIYTDNKDSSNNSMKKNDVNTRTAILMDLLQTIFEQIRLVANAHLTVIKYFNQTIARHKLTLKAYEMSDYWSKVQAVLQLLLTDYLDIQNISEPETSATYIEQTNDINSFFSRRKIQSKKRNALFKFDHSSHAVSNPINKGTNSSAPDSSSESWKHSGFQKRKRNKRLVCTPTPNNITIIFIPLVKFIEEIERELSCKPGVQCTLNAFLADYIKEVYLGRHHLSISTKVDAVTKSHDAWRSIIDLETIKEMALQRPLLQSTVLVNTCIWETRNLMLSIPLYADNFFSVICMVLKQYRETCQSAYRGIVQPETEDKRICSAAWLKDEDICRFLKTLPNWIDLKAHQYSDVKINNNRRHGRQQDSTEEESPEEIKQRNLREAEILASNLGEGGINAHEILSDVMVLKELAILQESMEWFSSSMIRLANELRQPLMVVNSPESKQAPASAPIVKENSIKCLLNLAQEFDELANTCLLVLHLEVRVQCFHYLLPKGDQYSRYYGSESNETLEPDPRVQELTKVLVTVDDAMGSSLSPRKTKYIFEGLGHLIAKILISASQYMDRIDEAGIRRMFRNIFALQQSLSNVTMTREVALDHAHQYYEMLNSEPEEILNGIMENGTQFSELEYMNAIQLIQRSKALNKDSSNSSSYLQRLSHILGDVGVTV